MTYNVLVLGSGGRESALAWKIAQSPMLGNLFMAPGNPGTASFATNIGVKPMDFGGVAEIVDMNAIDVLVVGPEDPLCSGIVDYLKADARFDNLICVGPNAFGAQMEGSKDFAKQFMQKYNIPTAAYKSFTVGEYEAACTFLDTLKAPYVLKADGLAAGKGVLIIDSLEEAKSELKNMLDGKFGKASAKVLIEEFLSGIELSVFVITDGSHYKILPEAKDYKRIGDGDTGLNTGGMGSVSPVPFADREFMAKVEERIVKPTIEGFAKEGMDYKGFVFFGLINVGGNPYVIEYNVRMGDPETESVMRRLTCDLLEAFVSFKDGSLDRVQLGADHRTALCLVAVSGGYPGSYPKGMVIEGANYKEDEAVLFHMGTSMNEAGELVTSGGRVMALTVMADTVGEARQKAYSLIDRMSFNGMYFRKDIGKDVDTKC